MEQHTLNWVLLLLAGCTFGELEPELRPITGAEQSETPFGSERSHLPLRAIRADRPPPPVSGGTLEANDEFVVAADPVRDTVWIVGREASTLALRGQVEFPAGAEPGRVLLPADDANEALVVLRGAGTVARIDLDEARTTSETEVCEAPRGIAARRDGFIVACVGGSLVYLDDELRVTERRSVSPDLRDVVVQYDSSDSEVVWVSSFRSARIFELRGTETVEHEILPSPSHVPRVAWRMRSHVSESGEDSGGVDVLHQQMSEANFTGVPLAYYGSPSTLPTGRIVQAAVAHIRTDGSQALNVIDGVPLAVDFVRRSGQVLLAAAFSRSRDSDAYPGVYAASTNPMTTGILAQNRADTPTQSVATVADFVVSFSARNGALVSSVGRLHLAASVVDTGHDLFHATTPAQVTCASCHPGGRDDAYVWTFNGLSRRTQPLTGGILASAPYHWTGELAGLEDVLYATFDTRMNGPDVTHSQVAALGSWLDALPTLRIPPTDPAAVARGEAIYAARACADCHDVSVDPAATLSRGAQAPPLFGVGVRGPYFFDGCAETLEEALASSTCSFSHPTVSDEELSDAVAYLNQL